MSKLSITPFQEEIKASVVGGSSGNDCTRISEPDIVPLDTWLEIACRRDFP